MLLLPVKKQKTPACIREIQVHRLWTKVYSPRGLTSVSFTEPAKNWSFKTVDSYPGAYVLAFF